MKIAFLTIFLLSLSTVFSQSKSDCEKILSQKIDLPFASPEDLENLNSNFAKLVGCGIESIDVEIFANGPILATLIMPFLNEEDSKITFQVLFDKVMEIKGTSEYPKIVEMVKASNELSSHKAILANWKEDKKLLEKIEFPEENILNLYEFLKENEDPKKTYKQLFEELTALQVNGHSDSEEKENSARLFDNSGLLNYPKLLTKAKEVNKPILLFFTGYACINSMRMKNQVLNDDAVKNQLINDFIFVSVFVEDKASLSTEDFFVDERTGKTMKTVGKKHSQFQIESFSNNTCPYFVIVDKNGKMIDEISYTMDTKVFKRFLLSK